MTTPTKIIYLETSSNRIRVAILQLSREKTTIIAAKYAGNYYFAKSKTPITPSNNPCVTVNVQRILLQLCFDKKKFVLNLNRYAPLNNTLTKIFAGRDFDAHSEIKNPK